MKLFNNNEFINYKIVYLVFFKCSISKHNIYTYNKFDLYINFFIKYFNNLKYLNINTIIFHKNYALNKIYSNYNMNFLYGLAIRDSNIIIDDKFRNSSNKVINIRCEFKCKNIKVFRKISILDIILKKFIEEYINSSVSLNFDKYNIIFFKRKELFIKAIRRKLRRMRKMLKKAKLSLRNFIRVTLIFLCTKDIDIFVKILTKIMNSMHFKNHRKFLYYLKLFISKSMRHYFEILKFSGFFFNLSGKISGGGNSKKKRYAIRCGKYSLTNKMLKVKYRKGLLHTKTGVLGFKFMISYS